MVMRRLVVSMFLVGLMVLGAGVVSSQDYPTKPIRIIAGGVGGSSDFVARLIAQELTGSFGQQVIVDNRGGSVVIHAEIVTRAPPDGYTLILFGNTVWLLPLLQDVPYDPVRDFSPVTLAVSMPHMVVVHPSLPVKSVKELIVLAKATPGALNYAGSLRGSMSHLAGELFKAMAGVKITLIPYKGSAAGLNDLIGGQLELAFPPAVSVMPHVKSGRLRALAVTSAQPSALAPGLPAVAASVPGYEAVAIFGIFAPARTPAPRINRLNQEIVRAVNKAEVKERFFKAGVEVVGSSPEQFAAAIKTDMARMGKVIKDAGIRAE